jgi:predicted metal-dependent peptidase
MEPFEDADADEALHDEWVCNAIQADIAAKSCGIGGMPSDLSQLLAKRLAPKICWKQEMQEFIRSNLPTRNDWARASRRMATAPCIYPRRVRDQVGKVVFVRDTSGSISSNIVAQFNSLIADSMREMDNSAIIIDADDRVLERYEVLDPDGIPERAKKGGGTDFRPAFREIRKIAEEGVDIAGIVYLTDLDGPEPLPQDVDHPLLWVCTTWRKARTGRTVAVNV